MTADQEAREKMWAAADGVRDIPQLHVDGKVNERENDWTFFIIFFFSLYAFFTLGRPSDSGIFFLSFFLENKQFIGTFPTIQEMEDFGELDAALGRKK